MQINFFKFHFDMPTCILVFHKFSYFIMLAYIQATVTSRECNLHRKFQMEKALVLSLCLGIVMTTGNCRETTESHLSVLRS